MVGGSRIRAKTRERSGRAGAGFVDVVAGGAADDVPVELDGSEAAACVEAGDSGRERRGARLVRSHARAGGVLRLDDVEPSLTGADRIIGADGRTRAGIGNVHPKGFAARRERSEHVV